ncbi:MAG: acylneuraminate cytidylyltransferase family protein [Anaerolineales bacterium]|nr:acylneuraminate cytidylyltransferase family protein [Anaerolineales bacterium]
MMTPKVLAIITARGGSKRIPGKNLLQLGGKSLVELAVQSGQQSKLVSRIVLSTDDEQIAAAGRTAGAELPFMRPPGLASDIASSWDVVRHAVKWYEDNQGWTADIAVLLQPSSPFRRAEHIDGTIQALLSSDASAALSVRQADLPLTWMYHLAADGALTSIGKMLDSTEASVSTQKLYQPCGAVYAIRRETLFQMRHFADVPVVGYVMERIAAWDIDEWWEFKVAELLWEEVNP